MVECKIKKYIYIDCIYIYIYCPLDIQRNEYVIVVNLVVQTRFTNSALFGKNAY